MAKHRKHRRHYGKHRRRSMRGFMGIVPDSLKHSARLTSPLAGIIAGLGVGLGLKALSSSTSALQSLPTALQNNLVPLGAVVAGGGLYLARHKKDKGAALGNLVGAVAVAAVVLTFDYLQTSAPQLFSGVVEVNLANGLRAKAMKGLLIANPTPANSPFRGMRGMLVRNPMRGLLVPQSPLARGPQSMTAYVGAGESDPYETDAP
jgi:hypothetical protein